MKENNNVETTSVVEKPSVQDEKKPKKKGPIIVIILLLIIVLGIGGYFYYDKFIAKKTDTNEKLEDEKSGGEKKEPTYTICGFKDSNGGSNPEKIPVVDDYITTCIREAGERGVNVTGFYGCKNDDCTLTQKAINVYYIQDGNDYVLFDFGNAKNLVINPESKLYKLEDSISELVTSENNNDFMMVFVSGTDDVAGTQYNMGRFYDKDGNVLFDGKYIEYELGFVKLDDKFVIRFTDKDGFYNSKAENKIYEYDYNMKLLNTYEYDDIYFMYDEAALVKQDNAIKLYDYDNKELVKLTDYNSNIAFGGSSCHAIENVISVFILDKSVTKEQVFNDNPDIFGNRIATDAEWKDAKNSAGYIYNYDLKTKKVTKTADFCRCGGCLPWDYYSNN